jgi:hypothetical protein
MRAAQTVVEDEIDAARQRPPKTGLFDGVGRSPVSAPGVFPGPDDVRDADTSSEAQDTQQSGQQLAASPEAGPRPAWKVGRTYVVVQEFQRGARDDAIRAQNFLRENGVETVLQPSSGRGYRLVTIKGFDRDQPDARARADQYLRRLRTIGERYFKAGGRYKLQGYFMTYTGENKQGV